MKKLLVILVISVVLFSCREEGPYIDFKKHDTDKSLIDTTYVASTPETPQLKNVLIEDFTGVQCLNCPKAASQLIQLISAHPGRISGIALDAPDNFGAPLTGSKEDYRTFEDSMLWNMLNTHGDGLPVGDVDRVLFSGETDILITYDKWSNYVDQRLAANSGNAPVNIHLTTEYDNVKNLHEVYVNVVYNQANTLKNYLSVALIEDSIIDLQEELVGTKLEVDSFYQRNHVMRGMLTPYNGLFLKLNPEQNRVFEKEFLIVPKSKWNLKNMKVVAFVSVWDGASDYEVLQTQEALVQ